jgi:hypothetical protein
MNPGTSAVIPSQFLAMFQPKNTCCSFNEQEQACLLLSAKLTARSRLKLGVAFPVILQPFVIINSPSEILELDSHLKYFSAYTTWVFICTIYTYLTTLLRVEIMGPVASNEVRFIKII